MPVLSGVVGVGKALSIPSEEALKPSFSTSPLPVYPLANSGLYYYY